MYNNLWNQFLFQLIYSFKRGQPKDRPCHHILPGTFIMATAHRAITDTWWYSCICLTEHVCHNWYENDFVQDSCLSYVLAVYGLKLMCKQIKLCTDWTYWWQWSRYVSWTEHMSVCPRSWATQNNTANPKCLLHCIKTIIIPQFL